MGSWIYASVGDSLSTDDYTGVEEGGAASLLFHNLGEKWPEFDGLDLVSTFPDASHLHLATNGTSVENILRDQVDEVPKDTKLITITAGLQKLITSLDRFQPGFVEKDLIAAAAEDVLRRYEQIVERLRKRAPKAHIIVTNVMDPADARNKVKYWIDWPGLGKYIKNANARIAEIAKAHDAWLADVYKPFRGHGITTAQDNRWLSGKSEINAKGANEIRRIWWQLLKDQGVV